MSRTIVKTGAVLRVLNHRDLFDGPPIADNHGIWSIYGDLHVVGNCCILYVPNDQMVWNTMHGTIDMEAEYFFRSTQPYSALVIPANTITMYRKSLHVIDAATLVRAGGLIIDGGEMGQPGGN